MTQSAAFFSEFYLIDKKIEKLHAELKRIQRQLDIHKEIRENWEQFKPLFNCSEQKHQIISSSDTYFNDMSYTDAVKTFFEMNKGKVFKNEQVRDFLVWEGVKFGKSPLETISAVIKRLGKQGVLKKRSQGRWFMPNEMIDKSGLDGSIDVPNNPENDLSFSHENCPAGDTGDLNPDD